MTVEGRVRRKQRWGFVKFGLLSTVAIAGIILIAAAAPALPGAITKLSGKRVPQKRYQYKSVLSKLAAEGYITFEERGGKKFARITEAGRKALAFEQAKTDLKNPKKRRWNGLWRIVIFDVPERRRQVRDRLRQVMREVGFARLQDSVWVYPYDCEEFVTLLKAELKLGGAVLYIVAHAIEHDKYLREHFHLPTA